MTHINNLLFPSQQAEKCASSAQPRIPLAQQNDLLSRAVPARSHLSAGRNWQKSRLSHWEEISAASPTRLQQCQRSNSRLQSTTTSIIPSLTRSSCAATALESRRRFANFAWTKQCATLLCKPAIRSLEANWLRSSCSRTDFKHCVCQNKCNVSAASCCKKNTLRNAFVLEMSCRAKT